MSDFGDVFNRIFGGFNVVNVNSSNQDAVIHALNHKFRDQIFDPDKRQEYEQYLQSVKNGGCKVFRNKCGEHKIRFS